VELALQNPALGSDFRDYLRNMITETIKAWGCQAGSRHRAERPTARLPPFLYHFAFFRESFESLDEEDSFEEEDSFDSFDEDDSLAGVLLESEDFESEDLESEPLSDLESDLESDFSPEGGWPVLPP
jgi:hypothetical protein